LVITETIILLPTDYDISPISIVHFSNFKVLAKDRALKVDNLAFLIVRRNIIFYWLEKENLFLGP
jgi:hypothetical protein